MAEIEQLLDRLRSQPEDEAARHRLISLWLDRGDGESMQAAMKQLATLLARRAGC